jgi:hypothetical protein
MFNFLQINYELVSIEPYPQSIPALNKKKGNSKLKSGVT